VVRPVRFPGEANSLFLFSKRSKDAMVHLIQSNEFVSGLKPILFFLKVKVSVFGGEGSFGLKSQYFFGHVVETIHWIIAVVLVGLSLQGSLLTFNQALHLNFVFLLDSHFCKHIGVFLLLCNCLLLVALDLGKQLGWWVFNVLLYVGWLMVLQVEILFGDHLGQLILKPG
jgi:hypothetical protein